MPFLSESKRRRKSSRLNGGSYTPLSSKRKSLNQVKISQKSSAKKNSELFTDYFTIDFRNKVLIASPAPVRNK